MSPRCEKEEFYREYLCRHGSIKSLNNLLYTKHTGEKKARGSVDCQRGALTGKAVNRLEATN